MTALCRGSARRTSPIDTYERASVSFSPPTRSTVRTKRWRRWMRRPRRLQGAAQKKPAMERIRGCRKSVAKARHGASTQTRAGTMAQARRGFYEIRAQMEALAHQSGRERLGRHQLPRGQRARRSRTIPNDEIETYYRGVNAQLTRPTMPPERHRLASRMPGDGLALARRTRAAAHPRGGSGVNRGRASSSRSRKARGCRSANRIFQLCGRAGRWCTGLASGP